MRRFFVLKEEFVSDSLIKITSKEANHISNVLRLNVGESVVVFDGSGFDYVCEIAEIAKKYVLLKVLEKQENKLESKINLTVYQALVKGEKFSLITQKLTELGASKIVPFVSNFTMVKENTAKLNKMPDISVSACKQCGRGIPVKIENVTKIENMLEDLKQYDVVLLAYEKAEKPISKILENKHKNVAIIIGSEGGFSKEEINKLNTLKNLQVVTMGKRILRAETATIALTSVVMQLLGEWE